MNLIDAAKNGNLEECKRLIENGVDVHVRDDYVLRWAAENGQFEICKLLLEHGANVHACNDGALWWAARNKHLKICKLLLEHGADLKTVFKMNGTPRGVVFKFATEEQIETARREWEIQKVMDA